MRYIKGTVKVESPQEGPVIVLRFQEENGILNLISSTIVSREGHYSFLVSPGTYFIAAFIDRNNDGRYQKGEHGNFHMDPLLQKVETGETVTMRPIHIKGPPPELESGLNVNIDIHKAYFF